MIELEMQDATEKLLSVTPLALDRAENFGRPNEVERAFACELATSVWLLQLGDEHASHVLSDYARARYRNRQAQDRLRAVLESEYRLCRERLDLCS